jgi:hypothetical protein
MRTCVAFAILSGLLAIGGLGISRAARASSAEPAAIATSTDIFSSPAALRHRTGQPTHWRSLVMQRP